MIVNVSKLQQIMSFVVLAAVIVAGVQCSNHEVEKRVMHNNNDSPMRIKAQSRISMTKGGYGARVQIREDLQGRKHAHAMAICDCNGQGPWRPLFKPSQILKTEFPEHESFHEEVDTQYRNMVGDHVDNHLRLPPTSSSEHLSTGPDSGGGFSGGGISYNGGGYGGGVSGGSAGGAGAGLAKKHNHMIHLHLIPHIYVPIMHSAGFSEAKNYQATIEDGSSLSSPVQNSLDTSSEFHAGDVVATGGSGQSGTSNSGGTGENPVSVTAGPAGDHDHGNFNGHSGETSYYTISDDAVQHLHQDLHDHYGNGIENNHNHDYEAPPNSVPEEPHQYQVHETDDLSKDYSNKNHVTSVSSTAAIKPSALHNHHYQPPQHKHRNPVAKPNRGKHGRKLSSRQDLKNLLVMRPPPVGQTQTWRYVYRPTVAGNHQQYYQGKQLPLPVIKTRTVPLILHIRQRSDDD
ncbi:uncharacterized protein LOC100568811 [Acyrthosiphon pisum]|uniref:Uncharacterized protein n=1 Tax=Acyrthosiphon pisum TaxID=7029 RepID=A0A8R1W7V1_ACYPI|nr:uncharacterized protein LOC100568811 [Acyrthosiphon pisum]|eukprot:XP_003248014.1 PREDICTED: uncharacterized protein LOC100568811 [Acyrthosiphon pisum]